MGSMFMSMLLNGVKNLLGKKSTRDILKYIATATLSHASEKLGINQYKYDPIDTKTMVYHYNLNNNNKINPNDVETAINLGAIERFLDDVNMQSGDNINMNEVIEVLAKACNDTGLVNIYNNQTLRQFNSDTLETSSIADNYEISSGGIYLPDRNIVTITNEGYNLANAKNDYLEKRMELGDNPDQEKLRKLIEGYYKEIGMKNVMGYF